MSKKIYILELQKDKTGSPLWTIETDPDGQVLRAEMYVDATMSLADMTEHVQKNLKYFKDEIMEELDNQKHYDRLEKANVFAGYRWPERNRA